jgi:hypothetical protein
MSKSGVISRGADFALEDPRLFGANVAILVEQAAAVLPATGWEALTKAIAGDSLGTAAGQHRAVCLFAACLDAVGGEAKPSAQTHLLVAKCGEYSQYLDQKCSEAGANPRGDWAGRGVHSRDNAMLAQVVDEIAHHVRGFAEPGFVYESIAGYSNARLQALLPPEIAGMRQEANIAIVLPFLEQSLAVPGDVAEFGCFRGVLSVKLAWLLKAAGADKTYYAFDTFRGFEIEDPAGGALGVGAFRDDAFDGYRFLTQWSKVLPVVPVKGDATRTCRTLVRPLSFVWLDLDMDVLMEPVLRQIWPLCGPDTLIGVDDVGRPETPTVKAWFDELVRAGTAELVFDSDAIAPNTFIRFFRKKGPYRQEQLRCR